MRWGYPARTTAVWAAIGIAVVFVAQAGRADELKLKDGTKISGTIVGFEENSFKVKTSYGYAEVQKDQVVSISITSGAKKPETKEKEAPTADRDAVSSTRPTSSEGVEEATSTPPAATTNTKERPSAASSKTARTSDASAKSENDSPNAGAANAPAPPKSSSASGAVSAPARPQPDTLTTAIADVQPAKPATPAASGTSEPMREEVTGNLYTNDTYGFRMFKPPDWQVIAGARAMLPGAITAMGTDDERTYLLIGQEPAGKSLDSDIDASEKRLRDIMENFRPLGETHIAVSGIQAVEHRFRGTVDQRDWSGVAVFVPRGTQLYTIFGMTLADDDLVQIQENVIKRAIGSLQFTKQ